MKYCRKFKQQEDKNKVNSISEKCKEADQEEEFLFTINLKSSNQCILDSGATSHVTNNKQLFCELDETFQNSIEVANGYEVKICEIGECQAKFYNEKGDLTNVRLTKVVYAPELKGNFISINK